MKPNPLSTVVAILVGASTALADPVSSQGLEYGHMGWGGRHGMFGGLMMLIFWATIVALIFMAVRWFLMGRKITQAPTDAMEILKSRYAQGELDEEQYRKLKSVLEE